MKRFVIAAAAVLTSLAAINAGAQETRESPNRMTYPDAPIVAAVGGGVFAASYIPSIIVAAESNNDSDKRLWAPVVGPWLDLADRGACPVGRPCDTETGAKTLLIIDGIVQDVSFVALVSGLIASGPTKSSSRTGVRFTPIQLGRGSMGAGLVGRF